MFNKFCFHIQQLVARLNRHLQLEALHNRQTPPAIRFHPNPWPLLQGQSEPAPSSHYNSFESEFAHINNGFCLVQNFLSIKVW
jgi:hypothetical protein